MGTTALEAVEQKTIESSEKRRAALAHHEQEIAAAIDEVGRGWGKLAKAVFHIIEEKLYEEAGYTNYKTYFEEGCKFHIPGDYATQLHSIYKKFGSILVKASGELMNLPFNRARELFYAPEAVQQKLIGEVGAKKLAAMSGKEFKSTVRKEKEKTKESSPSSAKAREREQAVKDLFVQVSGKEREKPVEMPVSQAEKESLQKAIDNGMTELGASIDNLVKLTREAGDTEVAFLVEEGVLKNLVRFLNKVLPPIQRCEIAGQLLSSTITSVNNKIKHDGADIDVPMMLQNFREGFGSCRKAISAFDHLADPGGNGSGRGEGR